MPRILKHCHLDLTNHLRPSLRPLKADTEVQNGLEVPSCLRSIEKCDEDPKSLACIALTSFRKHRAVRVRSLWAHLPLLSHPNDFLHILESSSTINCVQCIKCIPTEQKLPASTDPQKPPGNPFQLHWPGIAFGRPGAVPGQAHGPHEGAVVAVRR